MTRQIIVEILGDSKGFEKSVDSATSKSSGFSNVLKGVGLGIGSTVFGLASDAVSSFVGALGDAGQAYRDDQVSQANLATALKNNVSHWNGSTDAIEEYAGAQAKLGFQDDDIRASIGQLIGVTHDQTEAMKLNSLAQDLARAKGIDLAQATDIVTKAAEGHGKALAGLGIDITGATTAAQLLDAAQQSVAGSADAWAKTSEGQVAAANVKNSESWEKIGSVVDKITTTVLPIFADVFSNAIDLVFQIADAIQPLVKELVKNLTPAFNQVTAGVKVVTKWLGENLPPAIAAVKRGFEVVKPAIKVVGDIIGTVIDVLMKVAQTVVPIVIHGLGLLGDIWRTEFSIISTVIGTIIGAIQNLIGFFSGIGGKITRAVSGMWDGIWKEFKGVINTIIRGWNSLKFTMPDVDLGPLGHVGGFTIGTPNIPYLHSGGIVPGSNGEDVLTILQAGEQVIPRNRVGNATGDIHIHIDQGAYIDGPSLDMLANKITQRLRFAPGT